MRNEKTYPEERESERKIGSSKRNDLICGSCSETFSPDRIDTKSLKRSFFRSQFYRHVNIPFKDNNVAIKLAVNTILLHGWNWKRMLLCM